jgi:hypothetical protein
VTDYRQVVEDLFKQVRGRKGDTLTNPVTGERWVCGYDRRKEHKERAIRALLARRWFEWDVQWYAPDAPPLPLGPREIDRGKMQAGIHYLATVYAQSLQTKDWDMSGHPNFAVYCRAVMASRLAPDYIKNDDALKGRFPPYHEDVLKPGLVWPR